MGGSKGGGDTKVKPTAAQIAQEESGLERVAGLQKYPPPGLKITSWKRSMT